MQTTLFGESAMSSRTGIPASADMSCSCRGQDAPRSGYDPGRRNLGINHRLLQRLTARVESYLLFTLRQFPDVSLRQEPPATAFGTCLDFTVSPAGRCFRGARSTRG